MQLTGKVLITGGAGFIARAIYARAGREGWDAQFTAVSRDDAKHAALQHRFPHVRTVLHDVRGDVTTLANIMRGHDLVIHAAASKYVDRAETAAWDTVETNVDGSMNVARAAIIAGVPRVVGISTDKACLPVNVYGASKMVMERLLVEADLAYPGTEFRVVRYGNVVGSTGSVVTLFKAALDRGDPIHLTDPAMTRFWMSADEAIDVILTALDVAPRGHITVPVPRAMSLEGLAQTALGGRGVTGGLMAGAVVIDGMRPGEKMDEALIHHAESVRATRITGARGGWGYYLIAPPGTPPLHTAPFDVSSSDAPGGTLTPAEMEAMIAAGAGI